MRRYNDWSHNQMAEFYRSSIISALKKFDIAKNVSFRMPDFYEAMSWGGLQGTHIWSTLDSAEQTYYLQTIVSEANKGGCK